jgi:hypothetical protein
MTLQLVWGCCQQKDGQAGRELVHFSMEAADSVKGLKILIVSVAFIPFWSFKAAQSNVLLLRANGLSAGVGTGSRSELRAGYC